MVRQYPVNHTHQHVYISMKGKIKITPSPPHTYTHTQTHTPLPCFFFLSPLILPFPFLGYFFPFSGVFDCFWHLKFWILGVPASYNRWFWLIKAGLGIYGEAVSSLFCFGSLFLSFFTDIWYECWRKYCACFLCWSSVLLWRSACCPERMFCGSFLFKGEVWGVVGFCCQYFKKTESFCTKRKDMKIS